MTTTTQEQADEKIEQGEQREETPEEKEAREGFARGFNKVRGEEANTTEAEETTTQTQGQQDGQQQGASTTQPAAAAKPAEDPWKDVPAVVRQKFEALDALPGQIRKLAGNIGGLNSKIDSALATAKAAATDKGGAAAAPSDKQVQAAMGNSDLWKRLKEDYPDWAAPLEEQFAAIRSDLDKAKQPGVDVNALRSEVTNGVNAALSAGFDAAEERAFVRLKHPDWKTVVKTPEFLAYTVEGGPSVERYQQMKALEKTDPGKADAIVNQWAREFPQWWADRGAAIFDERADAAIKLLDGFKEKRSQPNPSQNKTRSQDRLSRSVPAQGTGAAGAGGGISDDAAFKRGFNRVRGNTQ